MRQKPHVLTHSVLRTLLIPRHTFLPTCCIPHHTLAQPSLYLSRPFVQFVSLPSIPSSLLPYLLDTSPDLSTHTLEGMANLLEDTPLSLHNTGLLCGMKLFCFPGDMNAVVLEVFTFFLCVNCFSLLVVCGLAIHFDVWCIPELIQGNVHFGVRRVHTSVCSIAVLSACYFMLLIRKTCAYSLKSWQCFLCNCCHVWSKCCCKLLQTNCYFECSAQLLKGT